MSTSPTPTARVAARPLPDVGGAAAAIEALELAWGAIRARHPDVPAVVLLIGRGSRRDSLWLRPGRCHPNCWNTTSGTDAIGEIVLAGEALQRSPTQVLTTLLHEAAHLVARIREIQDMSRQGRYHNARFKGLAQEFGLGPVKDATAGWAITTLPDSTARHYAASIDRLEYALTIRRRHESTAPAHRMSSTAACVCACGRRIRIAPSVLARGDIQCAVCAQLFAIAG